MLPPTLQPWDDISLTLETVTPTVGLNVPKLEPWTLSEYRPRPALRVHMANSSRRHRQASVTEVLGFAGEYNDEEEIAFDGEPAQAAPMKKRAMCITSKGDINATFVVPGLISVPSDGETHNVTVCELTLDAVMSWVSVPKSNLKAHLTVCILVTIYCHTGTK